MTTVPQVSQALQTLLTTAAEAADAQLHYTKRPDLAKFSASTLVQTLVFGWLAHPDASREQLTHTAAEVGVSVTPQAIDQRLTFATADLLHQVLSTATQHLIAADPVAIPLLQRFTGVRIQDSTTIVLPDALAHHWQGCGGSTSQHTAAALKCGVQFDLLTGCLCCLDLANGRAADARLPLQSAALPKGSLRLADLGFVSLKLLAELSEAEVYWLSKLEPTSLITTSTRAAEALLSYVQRNDTRSVWEEEVWVGKNRQVRGRLLIARVPQEVADQRRRRIRKTAQEKGVMASAVTLALAAWTILLTNIPARLLSVEEALVLSKVRWQIELLFKLWKSHGKVDEWRSKKPEQILCEVYAKLLAMVIQHWVLAISCWVYPDRSLVKAAQVVREQAPAMASARAELARLSEVVETISRILERAARLNPRRKHPNTYQLLLALTTEPKDA
jgi:hypothetical protein